VFGFRLHTGRLVKASRLFYCTLGGDGSAGNRISRPWPLNSTSSSWTKLASDNLTSRSQLPQRNVSEFLVGFLRTLGIQKHRLSKLDGGFVAAYTAVHYPNGGPPRLVDGAGYKRSGDEPRRDPHVRANPERSTREETRELLLLMLHDKSLVTDQMVDDNFCDASPLVLQYPSGWTRVRRLGGITAEECVH